MNPIAIRQKATSSAAIWSNLRQAIAQSSGFRTWQQEQLTNPDLFHLTLEEQVNQYLKDTLETLAY